MPFPTAARISARFMPNVCEPVSGRAANRSATRDPAMAPTSASMCPASASSASECERNAVATSKAMKAVRRHERDGQVLVIGLRRDSVRCGRGRRGCVWLWLSASAERLA